VARHWRHWGKRARARQKELKPGLCSMLYAGSIGPYAIPIGICRYHVPCAVAVVVVAGAFVFSVCIVPFVFTQDISTAAGRQHVTKLQLQQQWHRQVQFWSRSVLRPLLWR
jgi:hypothetical protein